MTISQMLGQSGLLTLLGMCVVFSFIIILIICMNLLRVAVRAFKLDKVKENGKNGNSSGAAQASNVVSSAATVNAADAQIAAAIAAALHEKE